jgi:hypothetical protein
MNIYKEQLTPLTCGLDPQSVTDNPVDTPNSLWWIPIKCKGVLFCVSTGAGGTSATYKVQYGNDHDGASPADLGTAYNVAHATTADVDWIYVPVSAVPQGKFLGIICTVAGTAVISVTAHAVEPSYSA